MSTASNTDFSAVANPSCVVDILKPVELSLLTNRSRSDGDWSTSVTPKAKTNLVPTGIGKFGLSFYAGGSFDALTGENLTAFAVVPATLPAFRNDAGQPQWRLAVGPHGRSTLFYLRYRFRLEIHRDLQWTIEMFGEVGASTASTVRPRFQTGVRYRPTRFSPSMSSMATTSPVKTPTGSRSAQRSGFPRRKKSRRTSLPDISKTSSSITRGGEQLDVDGVRDDRKGPRPRGPHRRRALRPRRRHQRAVAGSAASAHRCRAQF